jgi:hypothetical protein
MGHCSLQHCPLVGDAPGHFTRDMGNVMRQVMDFRFACKRGAGHLEQHHSAAQGLAHEEVATSSADKLSAHSSHRPNWYIPAGLAVSFESALGAPARG